RRLFGLMGHGICAICYFFAIYARNPWVFVLAIALAAFWNDITMGSAWASCLDIGGKYSGIVSGCMNTIGNLGGAMAGTFTGLVLDWYTSPARTDAVLTAVSGNLVAGMNPGTGAVVDAANLLRVTQRLDLAWQVNFC